MSVIQGPEKIRKKGDVIVGVKMKSKSKTESIVREIKRNIHKKYSAEGKMRIVLEGL